MKIGIIGLGVVGNANLKGFQMLKHDVLVHDKKLKTSTKNLLKTKMIFLPLIEMSDSPYENGEPIKNTVR